MMSVDVTPDVMRMHNDAVSAEESLERRDSSAAPVLQAIDLTKKFRRASGSRLGGGDLFTAVDHVSFSMAEGELLGLLGESGCGKSTLARMLMHLIPPTEGRIILDGMEIQSMRESAFRRKRHLIQMVYQNPFDCLDPTRRVSSLLAEPLKLWHPAMNEEERKERIHAMIMDCGLPENCLVKRPREFSGGQLQRIAIARALLAEPKILVADEIISALDVSIQNQILQLLLKMKEEYRLSILFITHDLSVARKMSDRVMVMQGGKLKGIGKPEEVFAQTSEPYIRDLAEAVFTFSGNAGS
ncbi:MAG: ABC transporter ATP-binding protein [Blautia sp.]|nr:ABC transporter ATP-binding protein [Blautia sp.]